MRLVASFMLLVLLANFAGCAQDRMDPTYGRASGPGSESVNGLAVLADLFERRGYRVKSVRRLSPKIEQFDAIVWAPDDLAPPSRTVRSELEKWLQNGTGRTLVYIGRDYDGVVDYWEQVMPSVPDSQRREAERRRATARSEQDARRAQAPARQYARWFTMRRAERRAVVERLDPTTPWSEGMDARQLHIPVGVVLDVAEDEDTKTLDAGEIPQGFAEEALDEYVDIVRDLTVPTTEVLLGSENAPLVLQVQDDGIRDANGQILVVVNGSCVLNLPLVRAEHRKLARRLIESVEERFGEPAGSQARQVAFLESGPGGPLVLQEEPESQYPTGLQLFAVWPLGIIVVHLLGLGVVACFAMFPIFGRPRERPQTRATHFAAHVQALGEMLAQSKDEATARQQVEHYYQTIRAGPREPGSAARIPVS